MKKFMKSCAITALILIVLGGTLAVIGGTVRGSTVVAQVVEEVTGGRIHASYGWPFTGRWGIFGNDYWRYKVDGFEVDISDTFDWGHEIIDEDTLNQADPTNNSQYSWPADAVLSLDIEVGGCSFETRTSENGLYYLRADGIGKLQFYWDDGVLHINAVNNRSGLNSLTNLSWLGTITFYVPEGCTYDRVDIEMGAGELVFDDLNADKISLDVGAGHILVRNLQAGELEASVGLGQLELLEMEVDVFDAEVGMGDLTGRGNIGRSGSLECAMGNMDLMLDGSERDFNYQLEASMGNIDLGRGSYSAMAMERLIDNGASKDLDVECSMGNISIRFTE